MKHRAFILAVAATAMLLTARLPAQVEDLGSSAQGIVDQMHAQADYWTPQMQQQSATAGQVTSTPQVNTSANMYVSPAAQRQMQAQMERIAQAQMRQQMMNQMAGAAGQVIGNYIAQQLFNPNGDAAAQEAARQAELARERQAEIERELRVENAKQMKINWDGRDEAMEQDLDSVLSNPAARSTNFFSGSVNADGPDSAPTTGEASYISASIEDTTAPQNGIVLGSPDAGISPEFLASQRLRAAYTPSQFPDMRVARPKASAPSNWREKLADALIEEGQRELIEHVKSSNLYRNVTEGLKYVPGYEWAAKAKSAFDYASGLKGDFDEMLNPARTLVYRSVDDVQESSEVIVYGMSAHGTLTSEDIENDEARLEQARERVVDYSNDQMKSALKKGLGERNDQDAQINKPDEEQNNVVAVNGPFSSEERVSAFHYSGGQVFHQGGDIW